MDRVEINGVWYVREDSLQHEEIEMELTHTESLLFENNDRLFEATRIFNDNGDLYSGFYITYINKTLCKSIRDEEVWDNEKYLLSIVDNKDTFDDFCINISTQGARELRLFIKKLIERGWK